EYTKFPTSVGGVFVDAANDNNAEIPVSSLMCMSRAVTVLRFVQLLLLLTDPSKQQISSTTSAMSEDDTIKMIAGLLQHWTLGVTEYVCQAWKNQQDQKSMEDSDDEDDEDRQASSTKYNPMTADASTNNDPRPVFCFCFFSLQRMNDYVNSRGIMLKPVWAGLSDLAQVLVEVQQIGTSEWQDTLPSSLLPGAMDLLCGFLQMGKEQIEAVVLMHGNSSQNAVASISCQGNLVGFIANTLSRMMRVYFVLDQQSGSPKAEPTDASNTDLMTYCWNTLFSLRGMATTLQLFDSARKETKSSKGPASNLSQIKVLCAIAAKAETRMHSIVLEQQSGSGAGKAKGSRLLKSALDSILIGNTECSTDSDNKVDNDHMAQFRAMSLAFGRVSVLQSVLEVADSTVQGNKELMLAITEDLLLSSTPQCLAACTLSAKYNYDGLSLPSTVLFKPLPTIAGLLAEISLDSTKSAQIHRLLIRWLAGTADTQNNSMQHPLSMELILSLTQVYISGVELDVGAKFVSCLSKLLFDARASPSLRGNVSSLLVRLQVSADSDVSELSKQLVEIELGAWIQSNRGIGRKKRKRKGNSVGSFALDPLEVADISRAVRGRGLSISLAQATLQPALRKAMIRLHDGCLKEGGHRGKFLVQFAGRNAVLIAFLERCLRSGTGLCKETFYKQTGLDISEFCRLVLNSVVNVKFDVSDDEGAIKKKAILFGAAMRLSATLGEVHDRGESCCVPVDSICALISKSVSKRFVPKSDDSVLASFRSAVGFDALGVLRSVGAVIPPDCEDATLQIIKKCFVRLLSSEDWPIVAFGITSLIRFGDCLDVTHKNLLPSCLTDSCKKALQCRVSKKVSKDKSSGEVENDSILITGYIDKQLHQFCSPRKQRGHDFFPEPSSFAIECGSYVLEMATQEGRKAKVIFPPGLESLGDIEYMIGASGETTPIHTVKRFVMSSSGEVGGLLHTVSK
ncbi:MAG: hypothetical protein SGILL_006595, partial [Bacillariaceae sp.]